MAIFSEYKSTATEARNYISKDCVKIRYPYQRTETVSKRYASLLGSTNHVDFLNDPTGNRRFAVIEIIPGELINFDLLPSSEQIWGYARFLHESGEVSYFNENEKALVFQESRKNVVNNSESDVLDSLICETGDWEIKISSAALYAFVSERCFLKNPRKLSAAMQQRTGLGSKNIRIKDSVLKGYQIRINQTTKESFEIFFENGDGRIYVDCFLIEKVLQNV
jgi:hypothetical protein